MSRYRQDSRKVRKVRNLSYYIGGAHFGKKVEAAIAANDKAAASEALTACISEINKATSKGIFHKNTASRKISRLSKAVNAIA